MGTRVLGSICYVRHGYGALVCYDTILNSKYARRSVATSLLHWLSRLPDGLCFHFLTVQKTDGAMITQNEKQQYRLHVHI